MLKLNRLSPLFIFVTVTTVSIVDLLSGTSIYYVIMMAVTLLCIEVTYNLIGGFSTFSGILFTAFSLRTIVISQYAKVLYFEPADKNLAAPLQTIAVYMVFYFCIMLGIFIFWNIRFKLPKPMEIVSPFQADMTYAVSLFLGMAASIIWRGAAQAESMSLRNFALGFRGLLLFAIVVAVDRQIKRTNGEHSSGIRVIIPWAFSMLTGFISTNRGDTLASSITYVVSCLVRGYNFKRKHYLAAVLSILGFVYVISPVMIYCRGRITGSTLRDQTSSVLSILLEIPSWKEVTDESDAAYQVNEGYGVYFNHPGTHILNRLSLIAPDSTMVSACSGGYHYGWTTIKIDALGLIPKILYKDKPARDSAGFTGRVTGANPDEIENAESALSPIADAYGSFGWWGIVVSAFLLFPIIFITLESIYDISQPWGTVTLGFFIPLFAEGGIGRYVGEIIRIPIEILLLSYMLRGIVIMIPSKGEREFKLSPPNTN